jgi:hypothetical protein
MSREFCYYCGEPAGEKIGCCGENHFGELYGFKCEDLTKEYPYGVEWSFDSDGDDIIDVEWFKTEDERDIFTEEEGFNMIREWELENKRMQMRIRSKEEEQELNEIDRQIVRASGIVYDPPMSDTEQYLLNKEREEEHKSYDY